MNKLILRSLQYRFQTILDSFTSNKLLHELSKTGRIDEARAMFDKMCERDEFSWNTMIAGYARCGRLPEAQKMFDETPYQSSSIAWSSLISGYSRHGCGIEVVLELFWEMQHKGVKPNQYTLGGVLRACSKFIVLRRGEQVHAHALKTHFDSNVFVITGLVDMYAKCKQISTAENLFQMVSGDEKKNHVLWTSMVTGYSQNGEGVRAIECFREMHRGEVGPNQFTFPSVLKACSEVLARGFGIQVHGCIVRSGFACNVFVDSALVDMYAKCGDFYNAKKVLEGMEAEDEVSWNSMIVSSARQGYDEEAISLFKMMHARDMKIDDFTYPSILNSFASILDVKSGKSVHCLILKTGFQDYKIVSNALIDMYAKDGSLACAFTVFHSMEELDVVSWTSLITGYAHYGSHEEALVLYCDMRVYGFNPDQFIIACVFSACAELTVLGFGQQVQGYFVRSGLKSSLSVNNSLVTLYAKCGCLEDASQVFDLMEVRDVVSWTALIVGHAQNGKGEVSLQLYDHMIRSNIEPDFVTFVGLLFACSHTGLVEDGRGYFKLMSEVYGIAPGPQHYACMIDLLGRSGNIGEAKELLNQMTTKPDATVWKSILAACRMHRDLELGEIAARNLFELEPRNSMPYVMLSNIYSAAGKWDDVARLRSMMKSSGISKEPGYSWMEINNEIHTFTVEDRSHPRMLEIYCKVDEMMMLIKKAGYVPDRKFSLQDMDEGGKELGLTYHSEKLAVAYGLLIVSSGVPIRIFKNLRVCGDCHNAIKMISRVFQRHIILRDTNCFHHLREGVCSCRDYW